MALPSLGANPRYLEELRIGGGYLSAPDGGIDMDKAGNLAMDGALTVGGELGLGAAGVDKTWSYNLLPRNAALGVAGAAAGPTDTTLSVFAPNMSYLAFDPASREWAHWSVPLPADYNASALKFAVFWYAPTGTVTGAVGWRVRAACLNDGSALLTTGSGTLVNDTINALNQVHRIDITLTPDSASTKGMLGVSLERNAEFDTFDADARFIACRVSYA